MQDSKWTSLSILVAIIVFLLTWRYDQYKHSIHQISLIKNLLFELQTVERHYEWYYGHIPNGDLPEHGIYTIDIHFYFKNLDYKIKNILTEKLKEILSFLNDKVTLINFYASQIFKGELSSLTDNKIKQINEKYIKKINSVLPELKKFIDSTKLQCFKITYQD